MPVLESPEVIVTTASSGLITLRQQVNAALTAEGYETDVGVNDPAGLNVLCSSIQVYALPVSGDCSHSISLSLCLGEQWAQKDAFLETLRKDHKIPVTVEPLGWGSKLVHISVRGQDNIHEFAKHLRGSLAETFHEGASIQRQIVNPALLGTAIDTMDEVIAESQKPDQSMGHAWAAMDWNGSGKAPSGDYGWKP